VAAGTARAAAGEALQTCSLASANPRSRQPDHQTEFARPESTLGTAGQRGSKSTSAHHPNHRQVEKRFSGTAPRHPSVDPGLGPQREWAKHGPRARLDGRLEGVTGYVLSVGHEEVRLSELRRCVKDIQDGVGASFDVDPRHLSMDWIRIATSLGILK
jgi:hypothetical protein